eukprot:CAMPEP_0185367052 /NCGR_PEP_ID=MMETSP1364-20130426/14118_1 /TAXON_ID=38817 /ORGANISM="Gephyrocapsa oceanica, Strain RCC1303" /LENGTH=148 /DNA_ID=CAMNT_0027967663 /DNA_START=1061 /DNA_END=1504 /DNA_ORIENTATION=+
MACPCSFFTLLPTYLRQRPQSARLQPSHAPHRSVLSTLLARLLLDGLTATSSSGDTSTPTVSPRSHSSMATLNWCCAVSSTLGRAGSRFEAPPRVATAAAPSACIDRARLQGRARGRAGPLWAPTSRDATIEDQRSEIDIDADDAASR